MSELTDLLDTPFTSDGAIEGGRLRAGNRHWAGIGTIAEMGPPAGKRTGAAYRAWREAAGEALLPPISEFALGSIATLAPFLATIEVFDQGTRFEFGSFGSALIAITKTDVTGQPVQAFGMNSVFFARFQHMLNRTVEERSAIINKPYFSRRTEGQAITHESLLLPLADLCCPVGRIVVAIDFPT